MPQSKTVSNLLALFIFLILYLCIQGCATFVVQRFVAHPESSLSDEFEAPKIRFGGSLFRTRIYQWSILCLHTNSA